MRTASFCFFCLLFIQLSAQTGKLNALRTKLPTVQGTAYVETSNELSEIFVFEAIRSDSAMKYATLAHDAAGRIGDVKGRAHAMILHANIYGQLLGNLDQMEAYSRKAILALAPINQPVLLARAYRTLALAFIWKSKIEAADSLLLIAKNISLKHKDQHGVGETYQLIGLGFVKTGQLWKGFEVLNEAQRIGKESGDSLVVAMSLSLIARAFNYSGDPEKSVQYYRAAQPYCTKAFALLYPHLEDLAYAYWKLNMPDSAMYFQQLCRHNLDSLTMDTAVRRRFAVWKMPDFSIDKNIVQQNYDAVIANGQRTLSGPRKNNDLLPLMHALLNVGKAYQGKSQFAKAVPYGRETLLYAHASHNKYFLKEGHLFLSTVFRQLGQTDSAFFHFTEYTTVKDAMAADQFALRTALFAAESDWQSRLAVVNKEKVARENELLLTEKELQRESLKKNFLGISLFIIVIFSALLFRNNVLKRKNERLTNEQAQVLLKKKALELEMQALRAQMNPHFIFNCLSAIDNLVQTNQADKATAYLSRFAKLIRSVLDSSKHNVVPFQRDFETLRLYLEMEKFRCNNKFSFNMVVDDELMNGDYQVPPLIIQPFVENAIQHGLLCKAGSDRQLDVSATLQGEQIVYTVTDNGIGRKQAAVLREINKPGHQSYGIDITRERINLYNKTGKNSVAIFDLESAGIALGTRAMVSINS